MGAPTKRVSRKNVEDFLAEMKSVLCDKKFNPNRDFVFMEERAKDGPDDEYTNTSTMLELGYTSADIIEELKTLSVQEYYETMVDTVSQDMSFWYIFCRKIQGKDVYIKVRMKRRKIGSKFVFCISFHFARHIMTDFPYK